MAIMRKAGSVSDERGSLSPLIIGYFTIAMLLIFLISNVAAAYSARRELTNRVEESLGRAAQELDQWRYYYGGPLTDYLSSVAIKAGGLLVPIDCAAARRTFQKTLTSSSFNDAKGSAGLPEIKTFQCDGERLITVVKEDFELPFQLRAFGVTHFSNEVTAGIGTRFVMPNSD